MLSVMFRMLLVLAVLFTALTARADAQLSAHSEAELRPPLTHPLTVMAFNVWQGGGNVNGGLQKIVDAIEAAGADVVGMQESSGTAVWVAQQLGWNAYMPSTGSVALLSRFPITQVFPLTADEAGAGVRLQISANPPQDIIVWSCHLTAYPYGPYQACFDGDTVAQIIDTQTVTQLPEIQDILFAMQPQLNRADEVPVFLMGDFNTPSHLDWIPPTAAQHCGLTVSYPVTEAVLAAGLIDVYRSLYPDPLTAPGNTWSPIFSFNDDELAPEPQDRIDQIHFAGAGVTPLDASVFVVGRPAEWPAHTTNAWPSDHAAVVGKFLVQPSKGVTPPHPELTLDRMSYAVGEPIVANFSGGPGDGADWVGLYAAGEAPSVFSSTAWYYTNNSQTAGAGSGPETGSVTFDVGAGPTWPLPPGDYTAYFLCCDGYDTQAGPISFTVF
ncbi:MAG: endonuclease/exonuclease/phosphatase family protein [Planctomycetota bacterium]|nr:endonuclease/exonuclease/phosphatase family protein [Planctomycetota bacterium]